LRPDLARGTSQDSRHVVDGVDRFDADREALWLLRTTSIAFLFREAEAPAYKRVGARVPSRDELKLHFESLSLDELRAACASDDYTPDAQEVANEVLRARPSPIDAPAPLAPAVDEPPAIAPDARCALHAESEATFVCSRCGAFACEACRGSQEGLCRACEERKGESREGLELGWLFRESAAVFVPSLPVVMGLGGLLGGLAVAQSWLSQGAPSQLTLLKAASAGSASSVAMVLVNRAVILLGNLVCIRLWAAMAQGASPSLGDAAAKALPRWGWAVLLELATTVATALATLACVIPGCFSWSPGGWQCRRLPSDFRLARRCRGHTP
jgi:hypothetical protein